MDYFPLFADLQDRPVLVVGGGAVAQRKVELLLKARARVLVVAGRLNAALHDWLATGRVQWLGEEFHPAQLDAVYLAIAATDDEALNRAVFEAAQARQRLVNVVDNQPLCNFIFPSIIDRSPLQIAISSGGKAPVLARLLRERLEALLPHSLGAMAQIAGRLRDSVKSRYGDLTRRRRFWEKLFLSPAFLRLCESGRNEDAQTLAQDALQDDLPVCGEVALVGAGPGDAGLLTLRALQRIQQADVVLYDALVSDAVLELVRRDAEKLLVGKRARGARVAQEEINHLLVQLARQGKRVVRLKGGDPFVFGRGGEELQALRAAGIPFEVVPGITAALGATAYAGIPLTHRDHAQSALFVTGHCRSDGKAQDWATLARSRQTLVVYMGAIKAAELTRELITHGRAASTPVAVISQGTLATQTVRRGTLADLPALAADAPSPALLVIGEVAALHDDLHWFGTAARQFVDAPQVLSVCDAA